MSPLERLLAEELPTGTFGDTTVRAGGEAARNVQPIAPARAAANRRALEEALNHKPTRVRHLRAVPTKDAA